MIEGFLFFIVKQLLVIAITALLFFAFGWWLRCKLNKCGATLAELEAEKARSKTHDSRLKELESQVKQAQDATSKAKAEASSKLVGMVSEAELTKAQNSLTDERRKASDLQAKIQRSDDGYKALRNAEQKILELQNDVSKAREEAMRLRTQNAAPTIAPDTEAELARMKNTVRTAETMAGDERRRAAELQKEIAALTEKLEKAKPGGSPSKATAPETALKSKADTDLAAAASALKATEAALALEKNRVVLLDREFKNAKALLAEAKSENEKLKAAQDENSASKSTEASAFARPISTIMPIANSLVSRPANEEAAADKAAADKAAADKAAADKAAADKAAADKAAADKAAADKAAADKAAADKAAADKAAADKAAADKAAADKAAADKAAADKAAADKAAADKAAADKAAADKAAASAHQTTLSFDEAPAPEPAPTDAGKRPEKISIATDILGKRVVQDDLKIVEGIGPKIEELLHADDIKSWDQLANASVETVKDILSRAGERFVMHDPSTWPRQALLAHEGKWDELRAWQDQLDGGKQVDPGSEA